MVCLRSAKLSIAICAMLLMMCFASASEIAGAKRETSGTVRFTDSVGNDVASYEIFDTIYYQIDAAGGKPGCTWRCLLVDGGGGTVASSYSYLTSWTATKTG